MRGRDELLVHRAAGVPAVPDLAPSEHGGDGVGELRFETERVGDQDAQPGNADRGEKRPFDEVDAIRSMAADVEAKLNGSGRLLLRYSGTENLARVMIEGKDQSEIDSLANGLADVIRQQLA